MVKLTVVRLVVLTATASVRLASGEGRIILVYPLDGCRRTASEGVSGDDSTQIKSSVRPARSIVLTELERKVNALREERMTSNKLRLLSEVNGSLVESKDDSETSVSLETHFLDALQMEIASVPEFMTESEMLRLSQGLSCVQMASPDYSKVMEDQLRFEEKIENSLEERLKEQLVGDGKEDNRARVIQQEHFWNLRHLGKSLLSSRPNDRLFDQQWHLHRVEKWSIGADEVWPQVQGSSPIPIAIIDSGCDLNHPELQPVKWINPGEICGDGLDNDNNGYVDDCHGWDWVDNDNDPSPDGSGHGTAAAGIIAAATNNSMGITGICWNCRIMCLRFIKGIEGRIANQIAAIDYAAKMGAKISNNSYGGYGYSQLEFEVIARVAALGHLFISSAGNNDHNTDLPQYDHTPSIYNLDNILAVGASTMHGNKAPFSNFGKASVDLFAPGSEIITIENGGHYASVQGTSFAAPMVAGAAGLLWSKFPSLTYTEIMKVLIFSCADSPALRGLSVSGGVLSLPRALALGEYILEREDLGHAREAGANWPTRLGPPSTTPRPPAAGSTDETSSWFGGLVAGFKRLFSNKRPANNDDAPVVLRLSEEKKQQPDETTRVNNLAENTPPMEEELVTKRLAKKRLVVRPFEKIAQLFLIREPPPNNRETQTKSDMTG